MRGRVGITIIQVCIAVVILAVVAAILFPFFAQSRGGSYKGGPAQNIRQVALAALMYGQDYDDRIPLMTNGWFSRVQNRPVGALTLACPGPGTQSNLAMDAAGARVTDTWVQLVLPFSKDRMLFVDSSRRARNKPSDEHGIFAGPPLAPGEKGYYPEGATHRNQGRFPMFGLNYMFLSPMLVPKTRLGSPDTFNYAEGVSRSFNAAKDPSQTVFFTHSQRNLGDTRRGFFAVNAPGMWQAFVSNKDGFVAFGGDTPGSGDWVGTKTACATNQEPCPEPMKSHGKSFMFALSGSNAAFLDGHGKFLKDVQLAAGTNYSIAKAGGAGHPSSGAVITDKSKYLWDLDGFYYGL